MKEESDGNSHNVRQNVVSAIMRGKTITVRAEEVMINSNCRVSECFQG